MIVKRDIIKKARIKIRELFPTIQMSLDKGNISKNDWLFFGKIIQNLINCFLESPENSIIKSKNTLNKIYVFYKKQFKTLKIASDDNYFLIRNSIDKNTIIKETKLYENFYEYWSNRRDSTELFFEHEIHMYLLYKWMSNYELNHISQNEFIIHLGFLCNSYNKKILYQEYLNSEKERLFSSLIFTSEILHFIGYNKDIKNKENKIIMTSFEFIQEAKKHIGNIV